MMTSTTQLEKVISPGANSEKTTYAHSEAVTDKEGAVPVDYSGAQTHLSPQETKLVKKLDLWIMVSE